MRSFVIGGVLAAAVLWPATAVAPVAAAASRNPCASWSSRFFPPRTIRVWVKANGGYVVERDFRAYVAEVMAAGAWPDAKYRPDASLEAGALAIKQYAWYEVLRRPCDRTFRGQPYDIENGGIHQLWRPKGGLIEPTKRQFRAVAATWWDHIEKHGRFIRTGWTGSGGRCGEVRDGWHLYEDGVTACARQGKTYRQIVRLYYGPRYRLITAKPWRHPELTGVTR